ncbi:MAG: D-alanyl-D-alanine carboxypeptidase/D-alanyl-D-alanine-endopeptidase [Bdellovibrionales bacterium]
MKHVLIYIFLFVSIPGQSTIKTDKMMGILAASGIPKKDISLHITNKNNDIFKWNSNKKRIPASLTKIFIASAAFDLLGSDYIWTSKITTGAVRKGKELKGHMCFSGGGNPSLISEKMWELANRFHRTGIRTVSGDIIVDSSFFDRELYASGRQASRVSRAYDSPVSGASFNWNSVNLFVSLDAAGKPIVYADPENRYITIDNKLKIGKKRNVKIERLSSLAGDKFIVSGSVPKGFKEKAFYRAITQPDMWTGENLKSFLERRGVVVAGRVRTGFCSPAERELARVESKKLSLVVMDMMKFSNNFLTEILVKTIAKKANPNDPGSMKSGMVELKKYFAKALPGKKIDIPSVSGLSQKNKIATDDLITILAKKYGDFSSKYEFVSSFPISGRDGTLKNRMQSIEGSVRAKTGLLSGVVGLAGFIQGQSGQEYYFVMVLNSKNKNKEWLARQTFDKMLTRFAKDN